MSSVEVSKISSQDKATLACSYAMMILHDEGLGVTAEKMQKLIVASGIEIEGYWTKIFAANMDGVDLSDLMMGGGPAGGAGGEAGASNSFQLLIALCK